MAKKNKRQVSRRLVSTAPAREDFNPDYSAVKKDLRTIGSLASFFVVVLIVLSFFLK